MHPIPLSTTQLPRRSVNSANPRPTTTPPSNPPLFPNPTHTQPLTRTFLRIAESVRLFPKIKNPLPPTNEDNYSSDNVPLVCSPRPRTVSAINEWVSTNTKGLIKQVVNQLAPDHKMVLVNTVHFQQDFQVKFEQSKTRKQDFTLFDGEKRKVNMMHMKHALRTCHTSDVSAVCLDFAHPDAMMVLILPNETGQNALLSTAGKYLDPKEFSALVKECTPSRIKLHLPKFELECSEELKEPLTALGMGTAFSDAAEFPRISPQPLKIDQVIHKTVLKVAENGVEAAAATAVMMGLLMMPPPEAPVPQFVFDRPFIVALADKRNDLVFFEGLVTSLAL
ncbi:putative Serpin [Blattamonas nauphoetae]|uniref:Serpin n=1 Tax=Blattamonas nauphoetae TaxID=2049346 RepID=A0ABQ9YBG3_9EUKA|nr:putative Serpin [Blattamonas nauphoetae]